MAHATGRGVIEHQGQHAESGEPLDYGNHMPCPRGRAARADPIEREEIDAVVMRPAQRSKPASTDNSEAWWQAVPDRRRPLPARSRRRRPRSIWYRMDTVAAKGN